MEKRYLNENVHEAACKRIEYIFSESEKILVAFGRQGQLRAHEYGIRLRGGT